MSRPRIGVEVRGLGDGVAVWLEPDDTLTNRWAGVPGCETRAAAIDAWIETYLADLTAEFADDDVLDPQQPTDTTPHSTASA